MSSGRRIARHTSWLLAGHVVMTAMLLGQAILLTRTLGASGYGVFVLVMTYVVTVRELLDSRVWEPILKFVPQFQADGRHDRAGGVGEPSRAQRSHHPRPSGSTRRRQGECQQCRNLGPRIIQGLETTEAPLDREACPSRKLCRSD